MFREVFDSGSGKECLDYLRSITVNTVLTPSQVEPYSLDHLEGQMYAIHLID